MEASQEWMDVETAAAELGVPTEAVSEAIGQGQLPAIRIGPYTRISRRALYDLAAKPAASTPTTNGGKAVAKEPSGKGGLPLPNGITWLEDLVVGDGFIYNWPKKGGGKDPETYGKTREGAISLFGQHVAVKVGEGIRHDRGRLTVFLDGAPTCEFAETADGSGWASLIKPDGKKTLPIGVSPPPLYQGTRVEPYRKVTGLAKSGIPNGLAVVLARSDYRGAVHHAAARWLGRNHHMVEPAN